MSDYKLGAVEARFADIVWENEPLPSGELVRLCEAALQWKKPTTYTVLRKLCARGLFRNDNGIVSAVMTREEFYTRQSLEFVEESFDGSLPAFFAAFTAGKALSAQEIEDLQAMINRYKEG